MSEIIANLAAESTNHNMAIPVVNFPRGGIQNHIDFATKVIFLGSSQKLFTADVTVYVEITIF